MFESGHLSKKKKLSFQTFYYRRSTVILDFSKEAKKKHLIKLLSKDMARSLNSIDSDLTLQKKYLLLLVLKSSTQN